MGKMTHTEFLYRELCFKELKKDYENKPEEIERILFLMQYEALKEGKKPVYIYKAYIDGNCIRIKYLSDLLRVMPLMDIGVALRDFGYSGRQGIIKNKEPLRKYAELLSGKTLWLVNWVLENEELDPKYFVYEEYRNKKRRLFARYGYYRSSRHWVLSSLFAALTAFSAATLIVCFGFYLIFLPIVMSKVENYSVEVVRNMIFLPLFPVLPCLLWVWRWTRPTPYEKNNHYEI